MPEVIFRNAAYDYETLRPKIFYIMDSLGENLILSESRVLIKPNLLAPATPDKAMVTHPLVVKAVVEYVMKKGGRPRISDSPAMGAFEKILKTSGIKDALKGLSADFAEFRDSREVEAGDPFKKIEIAADALDADVIINIPKLKTHSQMLLTLAVKNLFGCIVGLKKPEWHFRVGVDRELFARLLVNIYSVLKPSINILDGILAMEGQGPGRSGMPREIGIIAGSSDALALDFTVTRMLGLRPEELLTNKVSIEMGMSPGKIKIDGDVPTIHDLKFPESSPIVFGPKKLHGLMRRHLVQRPVVDKDMCRLCGECQRYCPAGAINRDKARLHFDYDKCIRCYCCIEVCPIGAIKAKEPAAGKIVKRVVRKR